MLVEGRSLRRDSCGAGKHRGGLGIDIHVRLTGAAFLDIQRHVIEVSVPYEQLPCGQLSVWSWAVSRSRGAAAFFAPFLVVLLPLRILSVIFRPLGLDASEARFAHA